MESSRGRARLVSRRLQLAISLLIALIIAAVMVGTVLALLDPDWLAAFLAERLSAKQLPIAPPAAFLIVVLHLVPLTVFVYGLICMRTTFAAIAHSEIISALAGTALRRAGAAFAISTVAMIALQPAVTALYSLGAPPGEGFISIGVGTGELTTLLMAGVFIGFGHLVALAAEIDNENHQIV